MEPGAHPVPVRAREQRLSQLRRTVLTWDTAVSVTVDGRRRLTADDAAMEDAATPPEAWTDYASINEQFARSPALQELLVRTDARHGRCRVPEVVLMARAISDPGAGARCSWCARGWSRRPARCSRWRSAKSTGKTRCGKRRAAGQAAINPQVLTSAFSCRSRRAK